MIKPIVNINFDNIFHRQNGPNQCQHVYKTTVQQYQSISFQISSKLSISCLQKKRFGCGMYNKKMRGLLIQSNGKFETWNCRGPLFIIKNKWGERLLWNNLRHVSRIKYFNNNIDTSSLGPPKATIYFHIPKVKSVLFEDQYDHINPRDNDNDDTQLFDTHKEHNR